MATFFGLDAIKRMVAGRMQDHTATGPETYSRITEGTGNVWFGPSAGACDEPASGLLALTAHTVARGPRALHLQQHGHDNIAIGIDASKDLLHLHHTIAIGDGATPEADWDFVLQTKLYEFRTTLTPGEYAVMAAVLRRAIDTESGAR